MFKKLFLAISLAIFSLGISYAEEGTGSCLVRGTANDYVEATAYLNVVDGYVKGNAVISNSASKPLMSYKLTVTADVMISKNYYTGEEHWQNITFFSSNCHQECEAYKSTSIDLKSAQGLKVKDVRVSISNATCE